MSHNVQVVKYEGKLSFERPRNMWENNIKIELELEEVTSSHSILLRCYE
jgi:hypothetical protein